MATGTPTQFATRSSATDERRQSAPPSAGGAMASLVDLTKLRITFAVTLTTATGYILAAGRFEHAMWLPVLGVFVLAAGSAALNQWQERKIDALMPRTCGRPIPSGRLEPTTALFVAIILILIGLLCLSSAGASHKLLLGLGAFALVWYNGVYTYLKRMTAFAVVPGALIGAVPPCIGYVAGGGDWGSPDLLLVVIFFFLWQVPHFWLLLLMTGDEYEQAGLPSLTSMFTPTQLGRMTFMWLMATAVSAVAFPAASQIAIGLPWSVVLVVSACWLASQAIGVLRGGDNTTSVRRAFWKINVFALIVMICLSANALGPRS